MVRANQLRHRGRQHDPVDLRELEEALVERAELVPAPVPHGRDPPVLRQLGAGEEAKNRLRVADVYGEQHPAMITDRLSPRSAGLPTLALCIPERESAARARKETLEVRLEGVELVP